ncbi:hypothetical protein [Escherichia coli]|uniref:hypothetical protein n=1 Tax=Escherichia coli TaxID=562 RepID=UPI0039A2D9E3
MHTAVLSEYCPGHGGANPAWCLWDMLTHPTAHNIDFIKLLIVRTPGRSTTSRLMRTWRAGEQEQTPPEGVMRSMANVEPFAANWYVTLTGKGKKTCQTASRQYGGAENPQRGLMFRRPCRRTAWHCPCVKMRWGRRKGKKTC